MSPALYQVWVDRGGTFTDCIGRDPGTAEVRVTKVLSSDAAQYISGVVLPVDGGWSVAGASAAALAMAQQLG